MQLLDLPSDFKDLTIPYRSQVTVLTLRSLLTSTISHALGLRLHSLSTNQWLCTL